MGWRMLAGRTGEGGCAAFAWAVGAAGLGFGRDSDGAWRGAAAALGALSASVLSMSSIVGDFAPPGQGKVTLPDKSVQARFAFGGSCSCAGENMAAQASRRAMATGLRCFTMILEAGCHSGGNGHGGDELRRGHDFLPRAGTSDELLGNDHGVTRFQAGAEHAPAPES